MLVTAVGSNCFILSLLLDIETKVKDISIKRKSTELTIQKNNISNLFSLKLIQIIIFFQKVYQFLLFFSFFLQFHILLCSIQQVVSFNYLDFR
jgi:hypothetical protein